MALIVVISGMYIVTIYRFCTVFQILPLLHCTARDCEFPAKFSCSFDTTVKIIGYMHASLLVCIFSNILLLCNENLRSFRDSEYAPLQVIYRV